MNELLTEQISHDDLKTYLKAFYKYAKKALNIERDPRIFFRRDQENADNFIGKTGYYDPESEEIHLFITDRHAKDVVRSFAHELIHHLQKLTGVTDQIDMSKTGEDPAYSLHDDLLRAMEEHAFKDGNLTFRDWTDKIKIGQITVIAERKLKPSEKEKLIGLEKDVPEAPFTKKYGKKKGKQIYYATLTKQAKKKKKYKSMKEEKTMRVKVMSKKHMEEQDMMKEADSDETEELTGDFMPPGSRLAADEPSELHGSPETSGRSHDKDTKVSLTAQDKLDQQAIERDRKLETLGSKIKKVYSDPELISYKQLLNFFNEKIEKYPQKEIWWRKLQDEVIKLRTPREERKDSEIASSMADYLSVKNTPSLVGKLKEESLQESKKTPYPVLFEQRERLLKEVYQTREERVYAELVRRFIKK